MPLDTQTIDLEAEAESLHDDMADVAEQRAELGADSTAGQHLDDRGITLQRYRDGVLWFMQEYDVQEITFSALTSGERHRVLDVVDETGWKTNDCFVAAGTVDAPYLEHDPEAVTTEDYKETCLNVVDLNPKFVDWARDKIKDIDGLEVETGNSYQELVREKLTSETSGETQSENASG